MRLFFTSTRGLLRRGQPHRGFANVTTILLQALPPVFNVALTSFLAYYALYLNPGEARWQLATFFVVGQLAANWVFFVRNRSVVLASPKNFPGYVHRYPSINNSRDPGAVDTAALERFRSKWRECESCDMHVPRRTHHCGHCGRCIFILDHHCYFLGQCVGRTNMRFFLVFCFYACLGCALGVYNLVNVMLYYRDPFSREAPFFLLPYTAVMYLMGSAASFEVLYVGLINFGFGGAGACAYLLAVGMSSVLTGRTPYEEKRRRRAVINYDRLPEDDEEAEEEIGPAERMREVFGTCPIMHLLVPVVPLGEEPPEAPVGYRRIIVYNNDYVHNGTICSSDVALDYEP